MIVCTKDAWFWGHNQCLFHNVAHAPYLDLEDGYVLTAAVFKNEDTEEMFLAHPDVAELPDAVFEGTIPMVAHRDNPARKYTHRHHELLKGIGVTDTDTVVDVSRKSSARYSIVKLKHIL